MMAAVLMLGNVDFIDSGDDDEHLVRQLRHDFGLFLFLTHFSAMPPHARRMRDI